MLTAWRVVPVPQNSNLDEIYRNTLQDLRIAWLEIRDEAQYLYCVSLNCPY